MIYKDRLTNPMTTLLRKESFSKQYYQSGITSSKGLNIYQVIFLFTYSITILFQVTQIHL